MYVAENVADSLAVVDVASGKVTRRFGTERYPYGVVVSSDGSVYVSAWGGTTVSVFRSAAGGPIQDAGRIVVGRHPSAMTLWCDGSRLFVASGSTDRVAVVDTRSARVLTTLEDPPPAGPHEGSTPNALSLSPDGRRLFVAEAEQCGRSVRSVSSHVRAERWIRSRDRPLGRPDPDRLVSVGRCSHDRFAVRRQR